MMRSGSDAALRDIVLLHGWGTNAAVWRDVAKRLGARFRLHAPTLPYGTADAADHFMSADGIAERLARSTPRRALVCGWSLGGTIALAWASRAPDQVAGLALIATSPCFVQRPDWRHGLEPWAVRDFARGLAREPAVVLTRYIALQAQGDAHAARVARHLRRSFTLAPRPHPAALERALELLCEADLRHVLRQVKQRVLVMHGTRDRVVPLSAAEYLAQTLPDARLAVVEGAAHAPFASQPEAVCATLERFFDE